MRYGAEVGKVVDENPALGSYVFTTARIYAGMSV
jgi:hypothetical protein